MSDLYMLLFDYNSDDNEDENDGKRTDDDDKNRHNKTLYDKIMRLEGIGNAFQNRTERISDITGIAQQYFLGDEFLPNPVSREDWIRFIGLRLQWQQDKARQKPLNTSFQDLRGIEGIQSQRFQEVEEAGSIFAKFGAPR